MDEEFLFYDDDDYKIMDYELYGDESWIEDDEISFVSQMTFYELYNTCISPTLVSTFPVIGKLFLYCLLLRFTNSLVEFSPSVIHLTSLVTGLVALHLVVENRMFYVVGLCCVSYASLLVLHTLGQKRLSGAVCALIIAFLLLLGEFFIVDHKDWHVIRGIQMVMSMKIISLAFDLSGDRTMCFPNPLEFGGYCMCVGTVIFGPWISYNDYLKLISFNRISWKWILRVVTSGVLAFLFLILSTCLCHWLIPDASNKWLLAYRDALSFRSSHYFVSFISEVLSITVGIANNTEALSCWGGNVSLPQHIEFPRSLTEVVIYWNKPVHYWLKNYVFKIVQPINVFFAIFCTYAASSLLHGLNFQLAAVLLSLGFYTYIEYNFRLKLANIFSACILARRCGQSCPHIYKSSSPIVFVTNLMFGLLAMFHLAYLGVTFDNSAVEQEQGYSMKHTLSKWNQLNYASHWVTVGTYVLHWLI